MRGHLTRSAHHGCSLLYMHLYAKRSTSDRPFADSFHGLVQLLREPVAKSLLDLLLRLAPGRNRLFQELASLRGQAKGLRAAIFVRDDFEPATSFHAFHIAT